MMVCPSAFTSSLPERQDKKISQGQLERVELHSLGGCHPSATLTGDITERTYVAPTPEDSDNVSAATAPQSWAQRTLTELKSQPLSWAWAWAVCGKVEAKPGDHSHKGIDRLECSPLSLNKIVSNVSRTVESSWVIEQ